MALEKEFIKTIKQFNKIIIYGAGNVGTLTSKYIKQKKLDNKIIGFAVTSMGDNASLIDGVKVYEINNLTQYREDALVVIAVVDMYQKDILETLKQLGFKHTFAVDQNLYNYLNINLRVNTPKSLFICEGYYHLLITLVKTLVENRHTDIVLTNGLDRNYDLISRLVKSRIVGNVISFNKGSVNEYRSEYHLLERFIGYRKNVKFFEKEFTIDLKRYTAGIYLYFDDNKIGRYIQSKKCSYTLLEDCFEFMNLIMPSKYKQETSKWNSFSYRWNKFWGLGYFPFGQSRFCKTVEVNSELKENFYKSSKIKIYPRNQLFERLSDQEKKRIYSVFIDNDELYTDAEKDNILIVTQPIYIDGFASSNMVQEKVYRSIIEEELREGKVYIKAHPRDVFDYKKIDERLIILDKNVPTEVYNFLGKKLFKKAVTLNSTAIYNMDFVDDKVLLGLEYIDKFEREDN